MKILIADDDPIARTVLQQAVSNLGHEVTTASSGDEAWKVYQSEAPEVVISDWYMPGLDGLDLCRRIREAPREAYVYIILVTGSRGAGSKVQGMEAGADDFLLKPVDAEELGVRLSVAARITSLHKRTIQAEERVAALEEHLRSQGGIEGMIGRSPAMQEVFRKLGLAAQSEVTVLLTGESGTGKELAARALHAQSPRRDGPFLAINCAAIPETLLESELFGHVKGAFTGAQQSKVGLFEAANRGTLFLDEVGDVTHALQLRLLRALQEREIRRVGDEQSRKVDVRIVAATNRDLKKLVAEGKVREDFYYRVRVFEITLPPLRDRREDIPLLALHFLSEMAQVQAKPRRGIAPDALGALTAYPWPGNVRELRNALEHALVVVEGELVQAADLPIEVLESPLPKARTGEGLPAPATDEDRRILEALRKSGGNRILAARDLGISRVTLWKKLKRMGGTQPGDAETDG